MARGGGGLQKPRGLYEGGLLTRKKRKPYINVGDTIREYSFAKPPISIVIISIDLVINFEDVF